MSIVVDFPNFNHKSMHLELSSSESIKEFGGTKMINIRYEGKEFILANNNFHRTFGVSYKFGGQFIKPKLSIILQKDSDYYKCLNKIWNTSRILVYNNRKQLGIDDLDAPNLKKDNDRLFPNIIKYAKKDTDKKFPRVDVKLNCKLNKETNEVETIYSRFRNISNDEFIEEINKLTDRSDMVVYIKVDSIFVLPSGICYLKLIVEEAIVRESAGSSKLKIRLINLDEIEGGRPRKLKSETSLNKNPSLQGEDANTFSEKQNNQDDDEINIDDIEDF